MVLVNNVLNIRIFMVLPSFYDLHIWVSTWKCNLRYLNVTHFYVNLAMSKKKKKMSRTWFLSEEWFRWLKTGAVHKNAVRPASEVKECMSNVIKLMHQPCDFVHDVWLFFFWFLSVRPSPPKCWVEGSEEKGGTVSLRCKSSQGSSPLKYAWTKESGNLPPTATQSEFPPVNTGLVQHYSANTSSESLITGTAWIASGLCVVKPNTAAVDENKNNFWAS